MTIDQFIKLLEAVAKILGALAWPLVALFIIWRLLPAVLRTIPELDNFSFDLFGFKASAERKKAAASEALSDAARKPIEGETSRQIEANVQAAREVVSRTVTPRVVKILHGKRILWVDDRPTNNVRERQAFEALGIRVDLALNTKEALSLLAPPCPFDLVISDMGRPPDSSAGYTLLDALRKDHNPVPFVIYASSNAPEHKLEAKNRGAIDCTNQANELFRIVTSALTA